MSFFGDFASYTLGTTFNILDGAMTSMALKSANINPLDTLYISWESPSGFSSWASPAYADPVNVALASAGFDTTYAPLNSAISNATFSMFGSLYSCGCCSNGLYF